MRILILTLVLLPVCANGQEQELREKIRQLETRLAAIEAKLAPAPAPKTDPEPDTAAGTTINVTLDGYYSYNFNRPVGRLNLLRAYDVSSNSFSLNQATMVIERAPDIAAGRRFGVRVDLQYGQATDTLQGSAANEPRPQVYRPLFQAYGTYVVPIKTGVTVDFGKWASALGIENNFTKDQYNYSRSYFFNFLPFYHFGFRASTDVNKHLSATYWLVNGAQQSEDFNGFKSQALLLTIRPTPKVSWSVNYFGGLEAREAGRRMTVLDTYVTWNPTPKLTLAAEADYVNHQGHVAGGAAYARYQFNPQWAMAGRAEYLSDRGGVFSGVTQALKEFTLTVDRKIGDGFLVRSEFRRDFSNQPYFLTERPGVLKREQNTATLGLIWWFGGKQGAW